MKALPWTREREYVWRNGSEALLLDHFDDCDIHDPDKCECTEIWVRDDKTGNWDSLGIFDNCVKAEREAEKFMREHPDGWMEKALNKFKETFILS